MAKVVCTQCQAIGQGECLDKAWANVPHMGERHPAEREPYGFARIMGNARTVEEVEFAQVCFAIDALSAADWGTAHF
jgi:hypothetical protein